MVVARSSLLIASVLLLGGAPRPALSASQFATVGALSRFMNPTWNGSPIDYCLHYEFVNYGPDNSLVAKHGHDCGEPAASEFCARQGYKRGSENFTAIYYSRNATYVLGDDTINPMDINMGKGEHTFFDKIICRSSQGGVR